ncbi:MAG: hypothetical protein QNJ46_31795 [Leptolyngbyaceae cyanobacterium MO_188.B28]|nr:hypothetical protein [Leptolyngbyaceae cyanobacterium MO_188.B28]
MQNSTKLDTSSLPRQIDIATVCVSMLERRPPLWRDWQLFGERNCDVSWVVGQLVCSRQFMATSADSGSDDVFLVVGFCCRRHRDELASHLSLFAVNA